MKYEITNANAGISFTAELDFEPNEKGTHVAALGSTFWKEDGWDWQPVAEPGKFYKAVTDSGFNVVFARREGDDDVAALFSDGSYNGNLPMDNLTEIEPL